MSFTAGDMTNVSILKWEIFMKAMHAGNEIALIQFTVEYEDCKKEYL